MLLAMDIANSRVTVGCMEGTRVVRLCRLSAEAERTEDEYAALLRQIWRDEVDWRSFEGAIVSSVAPPLTGTLCAAVKRLCACTPLVVGAGIRTGLNIRLDDPAQVGADLVAAAVGALAETPPPLVVVSLGTATAFTVIDAQAHFRGGAIAPGVGLGMAALSAGAFQLPGVPLEAPKSCIGANTVDAMKSGAIFGTAALIDGFLERIERELGDAVNAVATGPMAEAVVPYCVRKIACDEYLPLRGLALIYRKNKREARRQEAVF